MLREKLVLSSVLAPGDWHQFLVTTVELQMHASDIFLHPCVVFFFGSLSLGLFFIRVPVSELRVHCYPLLFHPSILFVNILRSHPWSLRGASVQDTIELIKVWWGAHQVITIQTQFVANWSLNFKQLGHSGLWGPMCIPEYLEKEILRAKATSWYLILQLQQGSFTQASTLTEAEISSYLEGVLRTQAV